MEASRGRMLYANCMRNLMVNQSAALYMTDGCGEFHSTTAIEGSSAAPAAATGASTARRRSTKGMWDGHNKLCARHCSNTQQIACTMNNK
ncbi:hypothetical protein HPP92_010739 [Vanilla planifolia]|uniref:Uncharacterized protein n=1 Tax=Vanilla planifolia TaxID=51239 RepID=A0A835R741_VANPL|nr:hypothetical protein HPP92_010739 [Vanilla planifolia]